MKKIFVFLALAMTTQILSATAATAPAIAYELPEECGDRNQYILEGHPWTEEMSRFDVGDAFTDGYVRAGMLGCERVYRRCFEVNRAAARRDAPDAAAKTDKPAADYDLQNTIIPNFNACRAFYRNYRNLRS